MADVKTRGMESILRMKLEFLEKTGMRAPTHVFMDAGMLMALTGEKKKGLRGGQWRIHGMEVVIIDRPRLLVGLCGEVG